MIHIDTLRLRLPRHLQPHAQTIAYQLAENLANAGIERDGRLEHCRIPRVRVALHATPSAIAEAASRSIVSHLEAKP